MYYVGLEVVFGRLYFVCLVVQGIKLKFVRFGVVLKFARAFCYLIVKYGRLRFSTGDMLMFFIACAPNRRC